jgi:hypothetical protein
LPPSQEAEDLFVRQWRQKSVRVDEAGYDKEKKPVIASTACGNALAPEQVQEEPTACAPCRPRDKFPLYFLQMSRYFGQNLNSVRRRSPESVQ